MAENSKKLVVKKQSFIFRGESFEINYHTYHCEDTNEDFTDEALDLINLNQVYSQYEAKHGQLKLKEHPDDDLNIWNKPKSNN